MALRAALARIGEPVSGNCRTASRSEDFLRDLRGSRSCSVRKISGQNQHGRCHRPKPEEPPTRPPTGLITARQPQNMLRDIGKDQVRADRCHLIQAGFAKFALDVVFLGETETHHGSGCRRSPAAQDASAASIFAMLASSPGVSPASNFAPGLHHQFGRPHLRIGTGERELDALVLTDRPAEHLAVPRIVDLPCAVNHLASPTHSAAISRRSAFMPSRM